MTTTPIEPQVKAIREGAAAIATGKTALLREAVASRTTPAAIEPPAEPVADEVADCISRTAALIALARVAHETADDLPQDCTAQYALLVAMNRCYQAINLLHFVRTTPAASQQYSVMFETSGDMVTGSMDLPVKRVEQQDDGTITIVLDYWPETPVSQHSDAMREAAQHMVDAWASSDADEMEAAEANLRAALADEPFVYQTLAERAALTQGKPE
jgi:hypothetical protein